MRHAIRQIDQTKRRVILGEVIPHAEKVFSIFEPHTEWISKGKAGVPVELGVKVCILEDQYQFILHHQVMQQRTDDQVTVSMCVRIMALVDSGVMWPSPWWPEISTASVPFCGNRSNTLTVPYQGTEKSPRPALKSRKPGAAIQIQPHNFSKNRGFLSGTS